MLDYWRLPGPSAFLADVLSEIGSGRNVVLLLPDEEPHDFLGTMRDSLYGRWSVHTVSATLNQSPIQAIHECVLGAETDVGNPNAAQLAADERFVGTLVIVQEVGEESWAAWKRFIQDYETACRRLPVDRRMLVVLASKGAKTHDPPASEVALAVLHWNDWVGETDMQVYAALRLRGMALNPGRRQLIAACLARIAVWDVAIVERFCNEDPDQVLAPHDLLLQMGRERGWEKIPVPDWRSGTAHKVDGAEQIHSAYLAVFNPEAIERRLWSAQASVLLPMIEQRRIALLPKVRRYINCPLATNFGTVERLEDLEIGQMHWHLHKAGADRSLIRTVAFLKSARDALAHLKPLARETCLDSRLLG